MRWFCVDSLCCCCKCKAELLCIEPIVLQGLTCPGRSRNGLMNTAVRANLSWTRSFLNPLTFDIYMLGYAQSIRLIVLVQGRLPELLLSFHKFCSCRLLSVIMSSISLFRVAQPFHSIEEAHQLLQNSSAPSCAGKEETPWPDRCQNGEVVLSQIKSSLLRRGS